MVYRRWLLDEPICGDYCDACGDCLHCYSEMCMNGGEHSWVINTDLLTEDDKQVIERQFQIP